MKDSEIRPGERVKDVHLNEDTLSVDLIDARTIIVPLMWYPRLFPPRSRLGLNVPSARCVARSAAELEDQRRGLWYSLAGH